MPENNPGKSLCYRNKEHTRFEATEPFDRTQNIEGGFLIEIVKAFKTVICSRCGEVLERPLKIQQVYTYRLGGEDIRNELVSMVVTPLD